MNVDPLTIIDCNNIDVFWFNWKNIFMEIMDQCIPSSVLPERKNLPWLTKDIIQGMRKKNSLFKKAKASSDYQNYKKARNRIVTQLRESK